MATPNLDIQNFYSDNLKANITAADTVIPVNNAPSMQEGFLVINPDDVSRREIIYFTSANVGAGTVTCPTVGGRGVGGTLAQSHISGSPIKCNIVAEYWRGIKTGAALANNSVTTPKIIDGAVTTAKMNPSRWFGSMSLGTITTSPTVLANLNVPAGLYLVIANFMPNHAGLTTTRDYTGRILQNGSIHTTGIVTAIPGSNFIPFVVTSIVTMSAAGTISFTIHRNIENNGWLSGDSRYTIIGIGNS